MNKTIIIDKIKSGDYDEQRLLVWLESLPNVNKIKPNEYKVGDVLFHKHFKHPYVLLEYKDGWICGLLTSNENCLEVLEQCNSRFFFDSYFTKTLFMVEKVENEFMLGVFDNNKQIKRILSKLREIL
jgi:hypothetical protein